MDRPVLNLFQCGGLWNLARQRMISAPETATLGLQHHGQLRDCGTGFCTGPLRRIPKLHIFISLWRHTFPQSEYTCDLVKRKQVFAAVRFLFMKQTIRPSIPLKGSNRLSGTYVTRFPTATKTKTMSKSKAQTQICCQNIWTYLSL